MNSKYEENDFYSNQSKAIKKIKLNKNDIISGVNSIYTFVNLVTFLEDQNVKFYFDRTLKKSKDVRIPVSRNKLVVIKPLREKLVITYLNNGTERKEVIEKDTRKEVKITKNNQCSYSFTLNGVNYALKYEQNYWRLYRNTKETSIQRKTLISALEYLKIKFNATL